LRCDGFERLDGRPVIYRDVCPGAWRALEVTAQDRSAAVYLNLVQRDRFPAAVAHHGMPPAARTLRTQLVSSPSMETRYRLLS
jgi:hypothetical protein